MTNPPMAEEELRDLNENYVRSVEHSDVTWFNEHLSWEFFCTTPDGALLARAALLEQPPGWRASAIFDPTTW